jgi:hypothetical protein
VQLEVGLARGRLNDIFRCAFCVVRFSELELVWSGFNFLLGVCQFVRSSKQRRVRGRQKGEGLFVPVSAGFETRWVTCSSDLIMNHVGLV